ncbi:uncharacterized protein [Nicotiana sylvestris]|uniref:uncharacterized protein isoform X1 n=1 Tax=Nicotiana sylvestris TaxID=4096 RepID=UPI00388CD351
MVFSFFLDILFEKVFPMWKRQHWCLLLLFVCRVIILLWKLRVKNFSKIVAEAILDFRSEHSIQLQVFLRHRASFLLFSFHRSYRDIFGQKLIEKGPERRSKTAYVNNCIIHVVNAVAL